MNTCEGADDPWTSCDERISLMDVDCGDAIDAFLMMLDFHSLLGERSGDCRASTEAKLVVSVDVMLVRF